MRAAGIDAYWETSRNPGNAVILEGVPEWFWFCNVFVAQPHLICAMIVWRLSYRGVAGWQKMSPSQRGRLAGKALVDAMLLHGGAWDEYVFTPEGLNWLKAQLGMGEEGFQRLLGQARRKHNQIAQRDLRWGLWLTGGCLAVGAAWWLAGSFARWPALVAIILGLVFGVHTLAYSLPRARQVRSPGFGSSHPSLERIRAHLQRIRQDGSQDSARTVSQGPVGRPYLDLGRCLDQAEHALQRGDAKSAMHALEAFAANDFRGIHTAYPEFYEILRACQESLGMRHRSADSQIEEMQLDWMTALTKGQQLLKAGKARESIAYFERSLKANPGEYGTAAGEEAARLGIKSAQVQLKRLKE